MARQVPVYKQKDDAGEILDGTFYEPELQSSRVPCEMERMQRPKT